MKLKNYFYKFLKIFRLQREYRSLKDSNSLSVKPYAFIRVCNEIDTIEASLNSILPVINKGVIGYHDCTDGSEEFILKFCSDNPGFIPFHYKKKLLPVNAEEYKKELPSDITTLADYYNEVLKFIPDGEWFIKIDCDHIYDTEKLKKLVCLPRSTSECIILSRLNLHYIRNKFFCIKSMPFFKGGDHWLIYKTPDIKFKMKIGFNNRGEFYAWEHLDISHLKWIYTDLMNWHFPMIKKQRRNFIGLDDLILLKDFIKKTNIKSLHISEEMIDEDYIYMHAKYIKFLEKNS